MDRAASLTRRIGPPSESSLSSQLGRSHTKARHIAYEAQGFSIRPTYTKSLRQFISLLHLLGFGFMSTPAEPGHYHHHEPGRELERPPRGSLFLRLLSDSGESPLDGCLHLFLLGWGAILSHSRQGIAGMGFIGNRIFALPRESELLFAQLLPLLCTQVFRHGSVLPTRSAGLNLLAEGALVQRDKNLAAPLEGIGRPIHRNQKRRDDRTQRSKVGERTARGEGQRADKTDRDTGRLGLRKR